MPDFIEFRYIAAYRSEGLMYRCIVKKNGKRRRSRWFASRMLAGKDALFWMEYYDRKTATTTGT